VCACNALLPLFSHKKGLIAKMSAPSSKRQKTSPVMSTTYLRLYGCYGVVCCVVGFCLLVLGAVLPIPRFGARQASSLDKLNPHLQKLPVDHLYHIGFSTKDDLEALFGDVQFIVMGGSASRMKGFASMLADR